MTVQGSLFARYHITSFVAVWITLIFIWGHQYRMWVKTGPGSPETLLPVFSEQRNEMIVADGRARRRC